MGMGGGGFGMMNMNDPFGEDDFFGGGGFGGGMGGGMGGSSMMM